MYKKLVKVVAVLIVLAGTAFFAKSVNASAIWQMQNPNTQSYFYTSNPVEASNLRNICWTGYTSYGNWMEFW